MRQIVGDFASKTQTREEKEQENANLIRQALSKLHESVKDKVSRSELKLLRETLEKTRNMEARNGFVVIKFHNSLFLDQILGSKAR